MNIKELAEKSSRLSPGHLTCSGCGIPLAVRTVLRSIAGPVVVVGATGCLEVTTTIFPYTSWECPFIHSAFENAAATASGICAAVEFLKKNTSKKSPEPTIVVFGGDGGTYDIGLQSLSGALERGHNLLYICYDNEAYMNTGVQRSSATPLGAWTTTSEVGKRALGKPTQRKNLTRIIAAHGITYTAQASISHLTDLSAKVEKALTFPGPKFINILQPCTTGWKFAPSQTVTVARLAVETRFWPLYEVVGDKTQVTVAVPEPRPVEDFLKAQGRFKHLFEPQRQGEVLTQIQAGVDQEWQRLAKNATI